MDVMDGIVFNIQRYSIDDGPGVRTTVFLKGCPLNCPWCSNPESINPMPEITYRYTSCKRCGTCLGACPVRAITLDKDGIHVDRKTCNACGACLAVCLPEALKISGQKMSVDEVFKIVKKDIDYYEVSGGGLTCSGGEVLAQPEFVAALFRRCRESGIHTCADTSGWGSREAMKTILEYCDLVYFDLKLMDATEHKRFCGQSNDLVLNNLSLIAEERIPVVLRIPLIPGCNDSDANITAIAEITARLLKSAPVHLLPYHKYGASKYRMLDIQCPIENIEYAAPEDLDRAKKIIESFGLNCEIKK
jgi:pyruvate formate lyase activating enzyme